MRTVSRALVGALAAAVLVAVAGCSTTPSSLPEAGSTATVAPPSASPAPGSSAPETTPLGTEEDPVRVAIVGDSLTAGGRRTIPEMGLDRNTWMTYAQGHGVKWVGGWAKGGTTVQIMSQHVHPAGPVDVLVLMAGTNDVRLHYSFAQAAPYYDAIVATLEPKHVIVGAIPPYDRNPAGAAAYEKQLKSYVAAKKWEFVDPWGFARGSGGRYAAGTTLDGIHPTTRGYAAVGREFRSAILRSVATPVAG